MKRTKSSWNKMFIGTIKKKSNAFKIEAELSAGEILALKNALTSHSEIGSSVGSDVLSYLTVAINDNEELLRRLSQE